MPWYTRYDYVKVEKYNAETGNFEFYWQDEFDSFDTDRWLKSENKGCPMATTRFFGKQVDVENGALVIKMDKPDRQYGEASESLGDCETGCTECRLSWFEDDPSNIQNTCVDFTVYKYLD